MTKNVLTRAVAATFANIIAAAAACNSDPTGVQYSTRQRGGSCASCHSAGIDYTRMNDSHP